MEKQRENFLFFQSENMNFVIDITDVREIVDSLDVFPFPLKHSGHIGVANCRGDVIDIVSLSETLKGQWSLLRNKLKSEKLAKTLILSYEGKGTIGISCDLIKKIELRERPARLKEIVTCGAEPATYVTATWLFENLEAA